MPPKSSRISLIKAKKKQFLAEYKPHDYQKEFHQHPAKYRAVVSGVGAGKTTLGVRECLKFSQFFPGSLGVIGRLTSKSLKETTQRRFFEICPPDLIEHWNATDSHLWLRTPEPGVFSEILFMHLDEPGPLGSLDIDYWWIDEAHEPEGEEVPEETFLMLKARLRGMVGPHRGLITTNSGGKDWVWRWFFKEDRSKDVKETHVGWNVPTMVNAKFLPPGYIEEMLATHPETWVKRFLYGSFDAFEGQIFTEFNRKIHTCKRFNIHDYPYSDECGFDFGISAPTVVPVARYLPEWEKVVIHDLYYRRESDVKQVADWMKQRGLYYAYADPSVVNRGPNKKSASELYSAEGITLIPSPNDVSLKISTIHWYLMREKLIIFSDLVQAIEEITNYRWDPNKDDQPLKKDDHFVDALGYLLMSQPFAQVGDPVSPGTVRKSNQDRHHSYEEDEDYNPYAELEEAVI